MEITFSINQYDKDGDNYDNCLLLHFNNSFILRLNDLKKLDEVINKLNKIKNEIIENKL